MHEFVSARGDISVARLCGYFFFSVCVRVRRCRWTSSLTVDDAWVEIFVFVLLDGGFYVLFLADGGETRGLTRNVFINKRKQLNKYV